MSLVGGAARTTLSSSRLRQRLTVLQRYLTAVSRSTTKSDDQDPARGRIPSPRPAQPSSPARAEDKAAARLARVGSRAALSFAFAFLRRAWRSGEDTDLCSELLQESLEALRALPEASLFYTESVSKVWLEVVERSSKFLHQVVAGDIVSNTAMSQSCSTPGMMMMIMMMFMMLMLHSRPPTGGPTPGSGAAL